MKIPKNISVKIFSGQYFEPFYCASEIHPFSIIALAIDFVQNNKLQKIRFTTEGGSEMIIEVR